MINTAGMDQHYSRASMNSHHYETGTNYSALCFTDEGTGAQSVQGHGRKWGGAGCRPSSLVVLSCRTSSMETGGGGSIGVGERGLGPQISR